MKASFRIILIMTAVSLLSACDNFVASTQSKEDAPSKNETTVEVKTPVNNTLDSSVVCCFCGMLDS